MEYEIYVRDGFVEVVTHGDGDVAVFQKFVDEALALREWRPGMAFLNDHTDLNAGPLTMSDISAIAELVHAARDTFGSSRLAVVADSDLQFGLARMWGLLVEGKWAGTANVFRTRADAVCWLTQP